MNCKTTCIHGGLQSSEYAINTLTLYSLTSVCIFSILLLRHFLVFWQGEFDQQSRGSLVGDPLLYSHDLSVWLMGWCCVEKLDVSQYQGLRG